MSFVPSALFAFETVVRVDNEDFYSSTADEIFCSVEDCIEFEILRRRNEIKILFEVFFDLFILPEREVLFVEFLARELFN